MYAATSAFSKKNSAASRASAMPVQSTIQRRALVLASASPRRRDILAQLGAAFRVEPSGIDETRWPGEQPEPHVLRLAREKASEVRQRLAADAARPCLLAAGTIVVIDGEGAGKPSDDPAALRIAERA